MSNLTGSVTLMMWCCSGAMGKDGRSLARAPLHFLCAGSRLAALLLTVRLPPHQVRSRRILNTWSFCYCCPLQSVDLARWAHMGLQHTLFSADSLLSKMPGDSLPIDIASNSFFFLQCWYSRINLHVQLQKDKDAEI